MPRKKKSLNPALKNIPINLQERVKIIKLAQDKGIRTHKTNGKGFRPTSELLREIRKK